MFFYTNVHILGTEWAIRVIHAKEDQRLGDCDGYTDKTSKLIVVDDCRDRSNFDEPMAYIRKVIRHEIIHAFMLESGLDECLMHEDMGQEEQIIDWFAYQYPKIKKVIDSVEFQITQAELKQVEDDGDG